MPVTVSIPDPNEYREVTLPNGYADNVKCLLVVGDHLFLCTNTNPGSLLKIRKDDFSMRSVLTFSNDTEHKNAIDAVYLPLPIDRIYVLFAWGSATPGLLMISEVNPNRGSNNAPTATNENYVREEDFTPGVAGCIDTDGTNLYVLSGYVDPVRLATVRLSDAQVFFSSALTGNHPHGWVARASGGRVYGVGKTLDEFGDTWVKKIDPTNPISPTVEQAITITNGTDFYTMAEDIGVSSDHLWIGMRGDPAGFGKIKKVNRTSFAVSDFTTGILAAARTVKLVGSYVWALFDNGKAARIEPSSNDLRLYTLNSGQGYQTLINTDADAFLYTAWYQAGTKIARYKIPAVLGGLPKAYGGSGEDSGQAVGLDRNGNIVMAGYFQTSIDFSGGTQTPLAGLGIWDIFIAKFSPTGDHIWSKRYGKSGNERVTWMAIDSNDNIFLGGNFSGTGNFGGVDWVAEGSTDAFLAKYNSSGDHQWSFAFGGASDVGGNSLNSLALDSSGNVVATGHYVGTEPVVDGSRPSAGVDSFLIKYDTNGNRIWGKRFTNGGAADRGTGVIVDTVDNSIYMTGFAGGSINLGGTTLVNQGGFLGKFDSDGNHLLSRAVGTVNTAPAMIALGSDRNPIVFGTFPYTTNLGNTEIFGGGTELFFVKYDRSTLAWAAEKGTTGQNTTPRGIKIDSSGNIYIVGFFKGTCNFGNQSLTTSYFGGFVAKYNSSFAPVWARSLSGTSDDSINAVTVDSTGPIVIGGFGDRATFDGKTHNSVGSIDILLARTASA